MKKDKTQILIKSVDKKKLELFKKLIKVRNNEKEGDNVSAVIRYMIDLYCDNYVNDEETKKRFQVLYGELPESFL